MSQIDSPHPGALPVRVPKSEFVAGRLCLALCNTVALPDAADRLGDAAGLAAWAERAGFRLTALPSPEGITAMRDLRDTCRAIFEPIAAGFPPDQTALDRLAVAAPPIRLLWNDTATRAEAAPRDLDPLARLTETIIADALALVTGADVLRIKQCPGPDCGWLFFDTSKNGKRRWCAMSDCGVKAKVNRYRGRHMTAL